MSDRWRYHQSLRKNWPVIIASCIFYGTIGGLALVFVLSMWGVI